MELLIITGMSGAGKSQAVKALEDIGWYCIDNMPAELIPKFVFLGTGKQEKVAFVVDIRGENEFDTLISDVDELRRQQYRVRTVFMDCDDDVLVNRYKFTRRTHPFVISRGLSFTEALKTERELLANAKSKADYLIDTTQMTNAQLREKMTVIGGGPTSHGLLVTCMSFGFKNGAASEADLVFDVRCFPNPYHCEELREHTGLEAPVREYVFSHEETNVYLAKLCDMIDFLLPLYEKEGKAQLIIAIGCTGGQHRSVAIAEALAAHIRDGGYPTVTIHRDIKK